MADTNGINAPALFFENFKIDPNAAGALVTGGSAALMSNSGSKNVEKCPLNDDSLYCQLSRTAGITGMIVYILFTIIFVIGFFYFLYYIFFRSAGKSVSKTIRKGRR